MRIFFILAFTLLFLMTAPVYAKQYNVNINCGQLGELPSEVSGLFCYWLPGWWSAVHGDTQINALRISLLTDIMVNACTRNDSVNILRTIRAVPSLPPAPDNGLSYTCQQFLGSGPPWQYMHIAWLQGYMAGTSGSTMMQDTLTLFVDKAEQICSASPQLRMEDVGRRLFKK